MSAGAQPSPQHEGMRSPLDIGMRCRTGEPIPRAGTWEIVDDGSCAAPRTLRALGEDDLAPPCPTGGGPATWQLTHLAPSIATDHRDVGPLP